MSKKRARTDSRTTSFGRGFALGLLLFLTLAAYWNSFSVPLVFDDLVTIQRNSQVRFGEFNWNFLSGRPILYSTFTLNHLWSGQEVWNYHFVSFALHLLNGFLIFILAERLFGHLESLRSRSRSYAFLAAGFFLLHPVQTESVSYISSRSEVLSTFFYLIGFLIFMFWPQRRIGFLCSLAVGVTYVLGLGSKETVVTLPAAILLYDFLFLSGGTFRPLLSRLRFYLTYLAGASAAIILLLTFLRQQQTILTAGDLTPARYFLTEVRVIVKYIGLILFPVGLNLDRHVLPSSSLLEPAVAASFLGLSGLVLLGWKLRHSAPIFAFSIFWFFITLSPTSSFVPILDVMFERRLYLPLAGVCLSFPLVLESLYQKLRPHLRIPGTAVAYSVLLLVVFLAGTIRRNYVWGNEVRLFEDVVSKSPGKVRPYNSLAWALYKTGNYTRAINVLETGIERLPDKYVEMADTLGSLYLRTGRYGDAITVFKKVLPYLESNPQVTTDRIAMTYNNLGMAYFYMWNDLRAKQGQLTEAEFSARREQVLAPATEAFQTALKIHRDLPSVLDTYINASCYRGKCGELEAEALRRLELKETFEDLYTVGKIAFNTDNYARADEYFERAESLRKNEKLLFFNHGIALSMLKQEDRAIEKYLQAIYLSPIFIEAHFNIGQLYMRRRDYPKAIDAFTEVLRQDPKHLGSNLNLAAIYISQGNKNVARTHLVTALETSPGNQQAMLMLEQLGL